MTPGGWQKHKNATECRICNKSLVKAQFLDSISVHDHDTGRYCGQSHRRCYYEATRKMKFIGPQRRKKSERWNGPMDRKQPGNMPVLRRALVAAKSQRLSEGPLPHHRGNTAGPRMINATSSSDWMPKRCPCRLHFISWKAVMGIFWCRQCWECMEKSNAFQTTRKNTFHFH